jgi:rhodanese-related sulfurtransferase
MPHPRDALFQHFARIGHALSSPPRLRLIALLAQAEKTVERLAEQTGQSVASASAHLKVLRAACLVEARRAGRHVYYRLASESVSRFWLALRELGEAQLPEVREVVRTYFSDPESLVKLDGQELLDEVRGGRVTLIDVRPVDEYEAGHLPDARNLPFEQIEQWIAHLPRRKQIVAYCRGPYCVTAVNAVARLREHGLRAYRLPAGVAEWRAAGLPLSTSRQTGRVTVKQGA